MINITTRPAIDMKPPDTPSALSVRVVVAQEAGIREFH